MSALILPYLDRQPVLAPDVFVAPNAAVIGNVEIGAGSSVWFNVTLRGDVGAIRVGTMVNIQDGTTVHVTGGRYDTIISDRVSIGHMALLHGCILEPDSFVGMGSIVMDGVVVESKGMVAAGSLVTPGKRIPTGELWGGRPARFIRALTDKEYSVMESTAPHYAELARNYRQALPPQSR